MKVEARVLIGIGVFFGCVGVAYLLLTKLFAGYGGEYSGTAMLFGTMMLGLFPGSYYLWWSRKMKARPGDDPEATHTETAGVVAVFPSSSVWPFFLGFGATLICLALVFGLWTAAVGFVLVIVALLGVVRESRRGGTI